MAQKREKNEERTKEDIPVKKSVVQKRNTSQKWLSEKIIEGWWKQLQPWMTHAFYGVLMGTGALFFMQWMSILPLYTDSTLRSEVQKTLKEMTEKEGWFLSGVEMRSITKDEIELRYHDVYRTSEDPPKNCFNIRSTHMLVCEKYS